MYQTDKLQQQNSLFGDLGMGLAITKPELPKTEPMSTIERLNIEKNLIGIFLSAHPLDEYEFEINHLCNITAEEMTRFDGIKKPEARSAAATTDEEGEVQESPIDFLNRLINRPLHFGGIVTQAEKRTSQKGNPFGSYVIEDYSGSYKMVLFGESYKKYAPMLIPNVYVCITGQIQQRGAGMQWFREKKMEEAEYEFQVTQVDMLKEVQQKRLKAVNLEIPVANIDRALTDEIADICHKYPGPTPLKLTVFDPGRRHQVTMRVQGNGISVNHELYHWFQSKADTFQLKIDN